MSSVSLRKDKSGQPYVKDGRFVFVRDGVCFALTKPQMDEMEELFKEVRAVNA